MQCLLWVFCWPCCNSTAPCLFPFCQDSHSALPRQAVPLVALQEVSVGSVHQLAAHRHRQPREGSHSAVRRLLNQRQQLQVRNLLPQTGFHMCWQPGASKTVKWTSGFWQSFLNHKPMIYIEKYRIVDAWQVKIFCFSEAVRKRSSWFTCSNHVLNFKDGGPKMQQLMKNVSWLWNWDSDPMWTHVVFSKIK